MMSRRELWRAFFRTLGAEWSISKARGANAGTPRLHIDRLLSENPVPRWTSFRRGYRADATLSVLGVPVFSRQDVGSGFVVLREAWQGDRKVVWLQFAGKSRPDRAHGVNDCGSIEEAIVEHSSTPVEAAYFAFITGAPDDVLEDARQRGNQAPGADVACTAYTAVDGLHHAGEARNNRASVVVPDHTGTDCDELIRQVRTGFYMGRDLLERRLCLGPEAGRTVPSTVLYAVANAARAKTERFDCPFVYNARPYHLYTEKSRDERAAALFLAKHLTTRPERVVRISGQVCERNRTVSSFKLWMEEGAVPALPLRIEFQPRPYLRVSLEFDPALDRANPLDAENQHNEET